MKAENSYATTAEPIRFKDIKPVRWRIVRVDGMPTAIAGIWEWRPQDFLLSFSMQTINTDPLPPRANK